MDSLQHDQPVESDGTVGLVSRHYLDVDVPQTTVQLEEAGVIVGDPVGATDWQEEL